MDQSAPNPADTAPLRLAIVVSAPIQHFCPMYRELAAHPRIDLMVLFVESGAGPRFDRDFNRVVQWQDDITEGFPHKVLEVPAGGDLEAARAAATVAELDRLKPDVVYSHGYHTPYLKASIDWAKRTHTPVMMTSDSELRRPRSLKVRIGKKLLLPGIFKKLDLLLTVGDANEDYFRHYGVDPAKFLRVPFAIDSAAYDKAIARRAEIRAEVRDRLGIPQDELVVLNVGKLIPDKGQSYLIRGFAKTLETLPQPATLLIAGEGADRPALEAQIKPLGNAVRLLGFIGVQDLPAYYLAADLYAHPSGYDPHPLAVSEAIYCGLPVIASDRIGSTGPTDDIQIDRNGWTFPYGDESAVSALLTRLLTDQPLRQQAGACSTTLGPLHASGRIAGLFAQGALRLAAARKA